MLLWDVKTWLERKKSKFFHQKVIVRCSFPIIYSHSSSPLSFSLPRSLLPHVCLSLSILVLRENSLNSFIQIVLKIIGVVREKINTLMTFPGFWQEFILPLKKVNIVCFAKLKWFILFFHSKGTHGILSFQHNSYVTFQNIMYYCKIKIKNKAHHSEKSYKSSFIL